MTSAAAGTRTTYTRPAEEIPSLGEWDVLVCGAGPAGCAAACAAARAGAKTLLVERGGSPGGAPVTQAVAVVLSTNAVDFQGVWHTWANRLRDLGGIAGLVRDSRHGGNWYRGLVDPEMVKYVWEGLLTEAGVDILYLAQVSEAIVEDGVARGAAVVTKGGPKAIFAKRVIDATGDGDFCARAGAAFEQGLDGKPWTQAVSLNGWFGGSSEPVPEWRRGGSGNLARLPTGLLRVLNVDTSNPFDLSRAMREGRAEIFRRFQERKARPGEENLRIEALADNPGVRASRRIVGRASATSDDAWNFRKHADGVAKCSWEIDIHLPDRPKGKGIEFSSPEYAERMRRAMDGDWFDIPYGCLLPRGVGNLLVAGRCISSDVTAQSCLRIQQTCMATGEAAGVAAARSVDGGVPLEAMGTDAYLAALADVRDVERAKVLS